MFRLTSVVRLRRAHLQVKWREPRRSEGQAGAGEKQGAGSHARGGTAGEAQQVRSAHPGRQHGRHVPRPKAIIVAAEDTGSAANAAVSTTE